jgi:acetyl esterase
MKRVPRASARSRVAAAMAGALIAVLAFAGCAATGAQSQHVKPKTQALYPRLKTYPDIPVTTNLEYGDPDGAPVLLDICFPKAAADGSKAQPARPALLSIHGGSWRAGDKDNLNWRSVCQWLASAGFVTFSVDYRLAPHFVFPDQLDDVKKAVSWMREKNQVKRYNIDPDRIGVFGGSAGGNLAALLGTEGSGSLTTGSRVAAVAELSGPTDLTSDGLALGTTTPDFQQVELEYLGCPSFADCPDAKSASPRYQVDKTDPPFFIGQSLSERIPHQQSDALVSALRRARVDVTYVTVKGTLHSIAMLDTAMRRRIVGFLHDKLGG